MANIFENCSYHSPYEPYYLNCTNTTNQCTLVQDVETIESIIFWIDFLIPCTLFVVACFLNAYYLSILVPEFTEMNDITKKQYIFMVSRAISALTACVIMLALRILQLITSSFTIYFLFFLIDDLSFYSLLGSYVGSAILLYLATIRPILYSNRISVRTVYKFAIANLITSVVLAITTAMFQAADLSDGPFQCDLKHCQPITNMIMLVLILTSFLIPIVTLSFVLVTLCFYKNRSESIGDFTTDNSVSKSARTRLAWTLFTFTLITLTEAIPSFYLVGTSIGQLLSTWILCAHCYSIPEYEKFGYNIQKS
ncbi:Putative G-protein coupled receptor B0244.4 [Caenorhabditis elegans]|uniref:Putative G-protein coupled receptor B0244.4 n=1 Tax=Caenorhabditis elegans TaxID=6239 RepID=YS94_CAEEL|nr:Putative G-protein coupled receptor B0244.4 [Caenorhabditis elegans]Q09964.3 RecName: Full=Putative G-protein coupled receptor B0244.4 [Caenorhabditis elegans]CCD61501.1 Putative G-protein coupled receptor B0244.4 [Caenorhabditis elegans]|eukprot:NP_001254931.1 Putative G-protein coupled receptor B0244.4 [Caenorhabditis elegans]